MASTGADPSAVAGPSSGAAEAACPICCARLPSAAVLSAHMASHSKVIIQYQYHINEFHELLSLQGRDRVGAAEEDGGGAGAAGSHAERSLLAATAAGRHGNRRAGTKIHLNSGFSRI